MLIHDPALSAAPVDGFVLGRWNFVFGWRALRPAGRPTRQRGETKHHCHPVPSARQWPLPSPASAIPLVLVLVLVLVIELRTASSRWQHARRQKDIKARHPIRASLFNRRVCATRHVRRCRAPIDYEHEHRCAEHEHEHESIGVAHNGKDWPAPEQFGNSLASRTQERGLVDMGCGRGRAMHIITPQLCVFPRPIIGTVKAPSR